VDDRDFVFENTPELQKVLGEVDAFRLQVLEGAALRLGEDATLKEAIAFFRDPGPPPPKRRPRGKG
jgi:hypothetical protein